MNRTTYGDVTIFVRPYDVKRGDSPTRLTFYCISDMKELFRSIHITKGI